MKTLMLLAIMFLPGCAAMVLNGSQDIRFNSDPPGATVMFRGQTCVTPCVLTVDRGGNPETVEFTLEGREPYRAEIARAYPNEVPRVNGVSKGLVATAAVIDTLIPFMGLVNQGSGLYDDWPKEIYATLPEKNGELAGGWRGLNLKLR